MTNTTRAQVSHDNPGWKGSGVPSLRDLTLHQIRPLTTLALRGEFSTSYNRFISLAANIWNFHLQAGKREALCPCCGWQGPAFIATSNWRATTFQSKCPQCDSRSRHRGLVKLLPEVAMSVPEGDALFFAPELILLEDISRCFAGQIYTTDFNSIDVDYPNEDIQQLSFADNAFAMIICNHVLEHVSDDQKALYECSRVLKPGGAALFTVPGNFDHERTWHFDELDSNGHYRHYGMDIIHKMKCAFDSVRAVDMAKLTASCWRVRRGDLAFVCRISSGFNR